VLEKIERRNWAVSAERRLMTLRQVALKVNLWTASRAPQ
jgi:hypothetical protein